MPLKQSIDLSNILYGHFSRVPSHGILQFDSEHVYPFRKEDLLFVENLGVSQYPVDKYLHVPSKQNVAVKTIHIPRHRNRIYEEQLEKLLKEIRLMHDVSEEPKVVKFYGWVGDTEFIRIFMEPMQLSLSELVKCLHSARTFTSRQFLLDILVIDLINAIFSLRSKQIAHRDIKPGNILFNAQSQFKISDFGETCELDETRFFHSTIVYNAPENFSHDKTSTPGANNVWCLGIILLEMLFGENPIMALSGINNPDEIAKLTTFMRNTEVLYEKLNDLLNGVHYEVQNIERLITECLSPCEIRPTFEDLMKNKDYERIALFAPNVKYRKSGVDEIQEYVQIRFQDKDMNKIKFPNSAKVYNFNLIEFKTLMPTTKKIFEDDRYLHEATKNIVAMRRISDLESNKKFIGGQLNHPNIVSIFGYCNKTTLFLCTEAMDMCLQELYSQTRFNDYNYYDENPELWLHESIIGYISVAIIDVLQYLNENGFSHGRLCPTNVHFKSDGTLKISNFDHIYEISKNNEDEITSGDNLMTKSSDRKFGYQNDIWYLGALITETIAGDKCKKKIFDIRSCGHGKYDRYNQSCLKTEECRNSVFAMFDLIKTYAHQIFQSRFYSSSAYEFIMDCLKDSNEKPTYENLKKLTFYKKYFNNMEEGRKALSELLMEFDFREELVSNIEYDEDHYGSEYDRSRLKIKAKP